MQAPGHIRPLRIGEILDLSIKLFARNAGTLFKIVLIVVVPLQVVSVLITLSTTPELLESSGSFTPPPQGEVVVFDTAEFWTFLAGFGVLLILTFLFVTLATGACYKAIADAYLGTGPEWKASMKFAGSRLGALLWVSVLAGLGTLFGFVACVIPGIWLWATWAVAIPALMTEEARGTEALRRSFHLVRGRWWPTFGALVVGTVFAAIVASIIPAILSLVVLTEVGESLLATSIVNGVANVISGVIATPFQAALAVIIYFDLRVRKEGFDLQLLAGRVGVPVPHGYVPPIHVPSWPAAPLPPPDWGPPPSTAPRRLPPPPPPPLA